MQMYLARCARKIKKKKKNLNLGHTKIPREDSQGGQLLN